MFNKPSFAAHAADGWGEGHILRTTVLAGLKFEFNDHSLKQPRNHLKDAKSKYKGWS